MKNILRIPATVAILATIALVVGTTVLAETYMYVDVNGNLQTETADTATEAIITAENRKHDSGVMLVGAGGNNTEFGTGGPVGSIYAYVDVNGNLQTTFADTATEAIVEAEARDPESGVMLVAE